MHYQNPDGLRDLDMINLALANNPAATAALARLHNDLDVLAEALGIYGYHLSGHGCDTKKYPDACNCGLDNRRVRAGLPRVYSKNGPTPYPRGRR